MITEQKYEVKLETLEPFRIGGKLDPLSASDNPVAIVGSQVVIPGSSLKGALRSQIEQYLIGQFYTPDRKQWQTDKVAWQPCLASTQPSEDEKQLIVQKKYRVENSCSYSPGNAQNKTICPACYFLGAQGLVGFVRVPFLNAEIAAEELYSARIDRATGVVAHSTNRPYQLIPSGVTFKGILHILYEDKVRGWKLGEKRPLTGSSEGDRWLQGNSKSPDEFAQEFITKRLETIQILGGFKSKGFGKVKVTVEPVK